MKWYTPGFAPVDRSQNVDPSIDRLTASVCNDETSGHISSGIIQLPWYYCKVFNDHHVLRGQSGTRSHFSRTLGVIDLIFGRTPMPRDSNWVSFPTEIQSHNRNCIPHTYELNWFTTPRKYGPINALLTRAAKFQSESTRPGQKLADKFRLRILNRGTSFPPK